MGLSIAADRDEKSEREKKQDDELEMQYNPLSQMANYRIYTFSVHHNSHI